MSRDLKFPYVRAESLRTAAVVCHRNADADAYLSAFALSFLLSKLAPGCSVDLAVPGGMTTLTTKLSRKFPHKMVEDSEADYDLYVAVDVGDTELLKGWKARMQSSKGVKVLVDHHPLRDAEIYDHKVVREEATSAAEVVLGLFEGAGVRLDRTTAQALLEAVFFDSSHLAIATDETLRSVVKLLDAGADLVEARKDLRSDPDYGEVVAKLKGAKRVRIYRVGRWVVATSFVGSFQAHVARALVTLGADVAVVGGETDEETRVSLRSTQRFLEQAKVELGTMVAGEVGKRLGGHGGGHATAASLSGLGDEESAVAAVLEELSKILGSQAVEVE